MPFYKVTYSEKYRRATVHSWGCNFRCEGCTYKLKSYTRPEEFLSLEEIQDCLRSLDIDTVHFMGGEPTTNSQLPEMLAFCKNELGVTTRLGHTNGSGLILENLDGSNMSFKFFDDDFHYEYTGRSVLPSLYNFRRSYEAGLDLKASTVFNPEFGGIEQVEKVAAFVGGIDRKIPFHISGYIPVPGTHWRRPTDEEMEQAVAIAQRYLDTVTFSHFTTTQAKDLTQRDERFVVHQVLQSRFYNFLQNFRGRVRPSDMIHLRGVNYTYTNATTPALKEVDLTVPEGEWVLLVGPSGGGKSTLLHLLNGLAPHVLGGKIGGEIQVNGLVPEKLSVRELSRQVGTVFQNPETQLFMLRVEEDIAFGCENLQFQPSETQHRVEQALGQLSLTSLRHQEVFNLSGGQKQRLAIAGALAMGCKTLLLDEPTSNLDEESRAELLQALGDLHQAGHTILMTEHRLEGLESVVDRVVTVDGGRVFSNDSFPTKGTLSRQNDFENKSSAKSLVEMKNVTFAYPGRKPVLEDLSINLNAGEMVALLGPNGCGKTTLLKLLCGLLRSPQGFIEIMGKRHPKIANLIGKVGLLFQDPDEQLFADTVYEEIAFGPKNLSRPVDVEYYLKRLGLERYRDAHPRSLSRGQRQRLVAATVLAIQPKLILLDEPTTGLDQDAWIALMKLVVEEAGHSGACVVFSTHHAEVVKMFASRVLTLSEGRVTNDCLY